MFYISILFNTIICVFGLKTEINTLSELPLEKLLQVQKTFLDDVIISAEKIIFDNATEKIDRPLALALQGKQKPNDRHGYHHIYNYDENYKKHDKKDIQSIFQVSVTTLAFLAFGGYLLCLICQAISAKNDNATNSTSQVVQAIIRQTAAVRRGTRPPRNRYRKRRPTSNVSYRRKKKIRPTRQPRAKREIVNEEMLPADVTEKMYWALIKLSEGYSSYHTIDYKMHNNTRYF